MWRPIGRQCGQAVKGPACSRYTHGLRYLLHHKGRVLREKRKSGFLLACFLLLPALQGCLVHTRSVQQAVAPSVIKDATADQLVQIVNATNARMQSLKANVTFQVSVGGSKKGKVTDYTSFSGYILLRAPQMLRVLGLLPVVRIPAFDLASDGQSFNLLVPHNNKAYTGLNTMGEPSTNPIENLRPGIFFDTMILPMIGPNDLVYRTLVSHDVMDPKTHKLLQRPEYELAVVHQKQGSQELISDRRIRFDRTTLLPSGIDIYDASGQIQTSARYSDYQNFGEERYPAAITISRPLEEYQIVIAIQKLTVDQEIADNQFEVKIPSTYTVVKLH